MTNTTEVQQLPPNAIRIDLPAWHDHTPAYTGELGVAVGGRVTLRLKTTLPVTQVLLKVVVNGEIETRPAGEVAALDGEGRWFEVTLALHAARVDYAWQLLEADDQRHFTMAGLHRVRRPYRDWFHYLAGYVAPRWAWKSFFYQVFPDRFRNGNPRNDVRSGEYEYQGRPVERVAWGTPPTRELDIHAHYGGDLEGVTQALPYLQELGVNALWLTPIFASPSAHRYDTSDYRAVDPHLGGQAAFTELMRETRARGVRVVLDGVFNHVGSEHALFRRALAAPGAPEREMFTFTPEREPPYVAFFGVPTLPKIDYASARAVNEFLEGDASVVRHWLREGVAGWRLDVAHMLGAGGTDKGNLELHRRLKRAAREERADAYVFGERFFDAEHALDGRGEDGVMNYHGFALPVMEWFSRATLRAQPSRLGTAELLDLLWDAYRVLAPQVALNQFNLLDSHDVPRALWRLGGSKVRLRAALTLLATYPGVPCLYYGTEVGLSQPEPGSMPFNRATMPWDEGEWDHDLLDFTRRLIALRLGRVSLREGNLRLLPLGDDGLGDDWLGYVRAYTRADGQVERTAVLASRRGEPHPVTLELPPGEWRDAFTDERLVGGRVTLDASGGVVLLG